MASGNERAAALDGIQYVYGDGPCLTAAREHVVVHVPDVATDQRWPGHTAAGIASVLGVPFEPAGEARAALNIYADQPHVHDKAAVEDARREVILASSARRLAVRLAAHRETEGDPVAALESRTTIELAAGIVMVRNRCTQQEAVEILKTVSDHRNVKPRELAATVGRGSASTHVEV
ncbi:GAF and ANTAR domain-containing protein [Kocuria sp. NPDC057446]|uniref:GAF and ANTAR domain-containing protein n=1 Tax=Kocuria sp. NPDC057446 TaxID=3346137 RepID=UPI0036CC976D